MTVGSSKMNKVQVTILVVLLAQGCVECQSNCPSKELLSPCSCDNNDIVCDGTKANIEDQDIDKVFTKLDESLPNDSKHFNTLRIYWTKITELKANAFKSLKFNNIHLVYNEQLTRIDELAFGSNNQVTGDLQFSSCTKLADSIFPAISNLVNLQSLYLHRMALRFIPSWAFIKNPKLYYIYVGEMYGGFNVQDHAFSKMARFGFIHFQVVEDLRFGDNVLEQNDSNQEQFKLMLSAVTGADNMFQAGTWRNHTRQTKLSIYSPISFLDQKVYEQFLAANPGNYVENQGRSLDCQECRNQWLTGHPEYFRQPIRVSIVNTECVPHCSAEALNRQCTNGNQLFDHDNFKGCKPNGLKL